MLVSRLMRALIAAVVLVSGVAVAAPSGTVYVLPEKIDVAEVGFEAAAKKAAVKTLHKDGTEWSFFLLAWLKKAAGASQINVAFYDKAKKAATEPDTVVSIGTQASAKLIATSLTVADDAGVEVGHTYDVRITRLIGGKEEVYARTQITFK